MEKNRISFAKDVEPNFVSQNKKVFRILFNIPSANFHLIIVQTNTKPQLKILSAVAHQLNLSLIQAFSTAGFRLQFFSR